MSIGAINIWHILVLILMVLMLVGGIYASLIQKDKKLRISMSISVVLVVIVIAVFLFLAVDKYTKKVSTYKVENKRLLSLEKIVYSGFVKNDGDYSVGEVTFEVKLVNQGHVTGRVGSTSFFTPSGIKDFFGQGANVLYKKPQIIVKKFVVAKNLKPGEAKQFRVYFDYPPYFKNVAEFTKVYGR